MIADAAAVLRLIWGTPVHATLMALLTAAAVVVVVTAWRLR